jgi:hypothetical protein
MIELHHFIIAGMFFGFGWFSHHYQDRRNRTRTPAKRSRAIPTGTNPQKGPGRPRKAKRDDPGPLLLGTPGENATGEEPRTSGRV